MDDFPTKLITDQCLIFRKGHAYRAVIQFSETKQFWTIPVVRLSPKNALSMNSTFYELTSGQFPVYMTVKSYTVFDFVDLPFTKQKSSLNLSCAVKACEYRLEKYI